VTALAALAGLCLAQATQPTPAPPTFRVDSEVVELDVSVTRGGKHVAGLTAADFQVLDSGVPQAVELAAAGDLPLSLILALDTSGSLAGERFTRLLSAAGAFLRGLRPNDRTALVSFSHRVRVWGGLGQEPVAVGAQLGRVSPDGMTALNDALYTGLALARGASGRCALVLFSDGLDNISWTSEADVLEAARASPAVVFVVASSLASVPQEERKGIARDPREAFLKKLAGASGGQLVKASSDEALADAFTRVLSELRDRYVLRYVPDDVPGAGWHPIEVKLKARKADVTTRAGYLKAASPR
jgi:Ca-activated chloride channel family protein